MLIRLLFLLGFMFGLPVAAQDGSPAPHGLDVTVKRIELDGNDQFDVHASGIVKAVPAVVWKILTNYERHPEFVPDLKRTRVLSRTGNRAVLEQAGAARFLFFKREIHLVVQVTEEPMSSIDVDLVEGDMKVYDCRWELTPLPDNGGTRIVYSGKLVPAFYVPGVLGSNIIRSDIHRMMAAVLAHIDGPG
jgi:ribosome-associated toxin RatA of RatAB toxin-antitoxin module